MDDPTPPTPRMTTSFSSSLPTNALVDFTKSPAPPSVPSGILSPTPPGTQPHDEVTSQNLRFLDGLSNPNISGTFHPHPSQLDRNFCRLNCNTFYVVTAGWEVGIFDNWYVLVIDLLCCVFHTLIRGIARTRVQTVKNNSFKSFLSWEDAVLYYTQCHSEDCIEIFDPVLASPTPTRPKQRSKNTNALAARPPATPSAVPSSEVPQAHTPHGIGTQSRPITVSPAVVPVRPKSARTRIRKGKQKASDIILVSSDSEGDDKSKTRPLTNPRAPSPPAPVAGRRRRILIIDDLDEEIDTSDTPGNPQKKVRRFRTALHTMFMQQPESCTSNDASAGHIQTVPLPVHLFDVSISRSAPGVAGPPGTVPILNAGPSQSNRRVSDHSEYEFTDMEPELLAALCKGT
jgi:hypothetical protein